ncbi:MAG: phage head closure protein [Bacillaceae bacterium]
MSEFDHIVSFETLERMPDPEGGGGFIREWKTFKECEASVQPLSGNSRFYAQQIDTSIEYQIFMEYDEEILNNKEDLRINHDDKVYTVKHAIDQGGLNEILCLYCVGE